MTGYRHFKIRYFSGNPDKWKTFFKYWFNIIRKLRYGINFPVYLIDGCADQLACPVLFFGFMSWLFICSGFSFWPLVPELSVSNHVKDNVIFYLIRIFFASRMQLISEKHWSEESWSKEYWIDGWCYKFITSDKKYYVNFYLKPEKHPFRCCICHNTIWEISSLPYDNWISK